MQPVSSIWTSTRSLAARCCTASWPACWHITDLYIDGILKVLDHDINRLGVVLDEVAAAAGDSVKVTVTVSADESALPHDVKKYL